MKHFITLFCALVFASLLSAQPNQPVPKSKLLQLTGDLDMALFYSVSIPAKSLGLEAENLNLEIKRFLGNFRGGQFRILKESVSTRFLLLCFSSFFSNLHQLPAFRI